MTLHKSVVTALITRSKEVMGSRNVGAIDGGSDLPGNRTIPSSGLISSFHTVEYAIIIMVLGRIIIKG